MSEKIELPRHIGFIVDNKCPIISVLRKKVGCKFSAATTIKKAIVRILPIKAFLWSLFFIKKATLKMLRSNNTGNIFSAVLLAIFSAK